MFTSTKVALLALVILGAMCLVEGCVKHCQLVCIQKSGRIICVYGCHLHCRRRREVPQNTTMQKKPFPEKFENYDLDKNGAITLEELAQAMHVEEHAKGTER